MDSKANDQRPWLVELPAASVIKNFKKTQNIYMYIVSGGWCLAMHDISSKMCFVENVVTSKIFTIKFLHLFRRRLAYSIGSHFEPPTTRVRLKVWADDGDIFDKCYFRRNVAEALFGNPRHFVENYICRKCPHAQTKHIF